jgi:putative FmdB family regulatory protein
VTYEYHCDYCDTTFEVIKQVKDYDREETCKCGSKAEKNFSKAIHLTGTSVQHPEYNPAFGCIVKNKKHRDDLAKKHNVEEIGNDYKHPDNIRKEFEEKRETKRKQMWDKD